MKLYHATVLDNNDPKTMGRVKIKVESLMDDCSDDMCPWASQFHLEVGGMTIEDSATPYGSIKTPVIGSLVWIFFADEENYKQPFFLSGISLGAMNLIGNAKVTLAIQTIINAMIAVPPPALTTAYPNLHYTLYPNGLVVGISNDKTNADCFVLNINAGSFMSMNTAGSIHMKGTSVTIQGTTGAILPNPTGKGGFCALPYCLLTGAPHTGDTIA